MLPESSAVAAAMSVAERYFSPAFLNHSVRSYVWGTMYGQAHSIRCDDELLCVAALLHDIALSPSFDSHTVPFEEAGGDVARVFGLAAGWPADRVDRVGEIIVLHMRDDVGPDVDPEAHLLQVATSWDVVGRWQDEFPAGARAEILGRYPRLGFGEEFLAAFQDQARRKPGSAAAASIGRNLAGRIAVHPLDGHPAGVRGL
ncbi:HD domain-containing protein [Dactylosporangium sp. NBC_01737]|uniref:HD domain-containing protein n=1 Tax=Dactylosporangium sp. NBC_01737 TaxID=2975959 RepID=UPI002E0EFB34|nr:HD domain-containing protein [Dactylosporangium sp. NBC_01737]